MMNKIIITLVKNPYSCQMELADGALKSKS